MSRPILGFLTVALLGLPSSAAPCTCIFGSTKDELKKAEAVFVGEVLGLGPSGDTTYPVLARLRVKQYWKGTDREAQVEILSDLGQGTCAGAFAEGTYLVYAYRKPQGLATWGCSRTKRVEGAATELKELGPGHPPTASK